MEQPNTKNSSSAQAPDEMIEDLIARLEHVMSSVEPGRPELAELSAALELAKSLQARAQSDAGISISVSEVLECVAWITMTVKQFFE